MSYFDEIDDIDEEMDEEFIMDDDSSDEMDLDGGPRTFVIEGTQQSTVARVDENRVNQVLSGAPDHPGLKSILDRTTRLQQLYGDKDGAVADLTQDIISEVYLLILEVRTNPSQLVLASLNGKEDKTQLIEITKLQELLEQHKNNIISTVLEVQ